MTFVMKRDRSDFSQDEIIAYRESWDAYMEQHDLLHLLIYIPMAMWQRRLDETNGYQLMVHRAMAADIVAAHIAEWGEIEAAPPPPLPPWKQVPAHLSECGTWMHTIDKLPKQMAVSVDIPAVIWYTQLGIYFSDEPRAQDAIAQMAIDAHVDRFGSMAWSRKA